MCKKKRFTYGLFEVMAVGADACGYNTVVTDTTRRFSSDTN